MEEWRDIKGYEGLYQVSNEGRVKSLERKVKFKDYFISVKERILKPRKSGSGYLNVQLCSNGITNEKQIHRLVAEAFIDNPDNLPQVNHKNEDKTLNFVENLEWCTQKYNLNYGTIKQRISESVKKNTIFITNNPNPPKKVLQYKNDELIAEYPSVSEAARQCGVSQPSISLHLKNKKPLFGYVWKYKNDQPN